MSRNQDEAHKAPVLTISANPALDLSVGLAQLVPGALHRAESVELTAAGKGVNMARVLAALGHPVCVTGFLGKDNDAAFVDAFARHGGRRRLRAAARGYPYQYQADRAGWSRQ